MADKYRTYLFSYRFDGAQWNFEIVAKTPEEAQERLKALGWATYDGVLVARIPAFGTGWIAKLLGRQL